MRRAFSTAALSLVITVILMGGSAPETAGQQADLVVRLSDELLNMDPAIYQGI